MYLTKIHGGGAMDRKRKPIEKQKKEKLEPNSFNRKVKYSRGFYWSIKN